MIRVLHCNLRSAFYRAVPLLQKKISEEVNETVFEHIMAGIEVISGKVGHMYIGVNTKFVILMFVCLFHGWWQEGSDESCHQGITSDVILACTIATYYNINLAGSDKFRLHTKIRGENGKFICNPQMQCTASAGIQTRNLLITEGARYRLSHHITLLKSCCCCCCFTADDRKEVPNPAIKA